MSLVDIILGIAVVVPWNAYLIYKMRKADAINNNTSNQEE